MKKVMYCLAAVAFAMGQTCVFGQINDGSTGPDAVKDSPLVRQSFYDSALEAVDLTDDAVWLLNYPENLFIPAFIRAKDAANALVRRESTKGEAALAIALVQYQFDMDMCVIAKRCSTEALTARSRGTIRIIKSSVLATDPPVVPCAAPAAAVPAEIKLKPPLKPKRN